MLPVKFKKRLCRPVEFKGQGPLYWLLGRVAHRLLLLSLTSEGGRRASPREGRPVDARKTLNLIKAGGRRAAYPRPIRLPTMNTRVVENQPHIAQSIFGGGGGTQIPND